MLQKLAVSLILLSFTVTGLAQAAAPAKPTEAEQKLQKNAIEFLRETSTQVNRLRLPENRVSFNAELASLMWFHDEKEARGMFSSVISDFKQLIIQLDEQANSATVSEDDDAGLGGFFGGYGRSKAQRKFTVALAVREQIAMSAAEHAPDLAFAFYKESELLVTNPKLRELAAANSTQFESRLVNQIAASDPEKAVAYATESLKKGFNNNHLSLLRKLYVKDPDKAISFGAAILSQLKSDSGKNVWMAAELLEFGDKNADVAKKAGKKPVYSFSELREIAELYGRMILDKSESSEYLDMYGDPDLIEKYSPSTAARIRAKSGRRRNSNAMTNSGLSTAPGVLTTGYNTSANISSDPEMARLMEASRLREARQKSDADLLKKLSDPAFAKAAKEEREKLIASSRAAIARMSGPEKKVMAYSLLASQVAKAGDPELAGEIMLDAERLVEPQPKNYQDFLLSWTLVSGYAQSQPEKAFPILENTVVRANGTIAAAIKMAEFIDVTDEYITDGETQVGMFGSTMLRSITRGVPGVDATLKSLARADFARTAAVADMFDRQEIQVLAKMLILRAVLDEKPVTIEFPDDPV